MAGPIVYISHWRIKPGRESEWWAMVDQMLPPWESAKPRTAFQNFYTDEAGTRLSIVHMWADREALDLHLEGVDARAQAALEFIEPDGFEVYGGPAESLLESLKPIPGSDGLLSVSPNHKAGFSRFAG